MKHNDDFTLTEGIIIIAGCLVGLCNKIYRLTHNHIDNETLSNICLGLFFILLAYKIFRKFRSRRKNVPDQNDPKNGNTD